MTDLFETSNAKYRAVLEHAELLENLLVKGDSRELAAYTARLNELQQEAGLHDRELLAEIARDSAHWQAHPLFQQRMQLLEQIMEMNDLLLPRIHGMMAVTGAELTQLKDGRTAISGYHPNAGRPKKSIRGVG